MLIITVESTSEFGRQRLGTAYIYNDGTGDEELGNYVIRLQDDDLPTPARTGYIFAFPRRRLSFWNLLERSLRAVLSSNYEVEKQVDCA